VLDPTILQPTFVQRDVTSSNLAAIVREIQEASLHLSHRRYLAQHVAAPIPAAALVESVVAALNQSLAVWEMSPIATAIDRDILAKFKRLFGYSRDAEGSLIPGGAFGNLTAVLAARDSLEPRASKTGRARIALIAGAQVHYTVCRAAALLGLGTDAVFTVPLDLEFRTDVSRMPLAFAAARKPGFRKFVLTATRGSTPTRSIDDLVELNRAARKERA
jgi:L-2,4-diaminobutyrate decarboxylase